MAVVVETALILLCESDPCANLVATKLPRGNWMKSAIPSWDATFAMATPAEPREHLCGRIEVNGTGCTTESVRAADVAVR